jgi:hypothetical protein
LSLNFPNISANLLQLVRYRSGGRGGSSRKYIHVFFGAKRSRIDGHVAQTSAVTYTYITGLPSLHHSYLSLLRTCFSVLPLLIPVRLSKSDLLRPSLDILSNEKGVDPTQLDEVRQRLVVE